MKIIEKRKFSIEDYIKKQEESRQKRINQPLDYEKYKAIYKVFWKDLTVEKYLFCHLNGILAFIELGYEIDLDKPWDNQPMTR